MPTLEELFKIVGSNTDAKVAYENKIEIARLLQKVIDNNSIKVGSQIG